MTIPTQFITLQNLRIAHAVAGEGLPLLLLHGWGANIGLVWQLAEKMVAKGYRVYALDLPSFGESQTPDSVWTVFDYANFVLAYLDMQGLERVYLFGHSFGGRLGLILGADYPQRIIKMALADSAGLRPKTPLSVQIRTQVYKTLRDTLYRIGLRSFGDKLRQQYNARYGSADFNAVSGVMRQTFINVIQQDLRAYAERATPSTLLFWGENDSDTPLWMGQTLEKIMPDAGLIVHKNATHYSYLEYLDETARVMDFFFRQTK
jgi:pimeloyl-ACP methyl ester carboxylesterase